MEHSGFPSDETLAAFIDGRLDDVTRRRVVEHMTTCDECYAVYLAATEMERASGSPPPRRRRFGGHLWAATLAVAAVAMLVVVEFTPLERYIGRRPSSIEPLVDASKEMPYRTIEGRLSGGFPWKPLDETKRDAAPVEAQKHPEQWKLIDASVGVAEAARRNPSPENLHALGISHLLLGNRDEAIATLQKALSKGPNDPTIHNDLATAYLARGAYKERASDYVEAVEESKLAWDLKKTPEIAWTRAVALEHLPMKETARSAWSDYLALDPNSPWRTEAEKHLQELSGPSDAELWEQVKPRLERAAMNGDAAAVDRIAARFPWQTDGFGEEMLAEWAKSGELKAFDAAALIGDVVAPRGYCELRAICAAVRTASPERLTLTREAATALATGRALLDSGNYAEASETLTRSRELAQRAGSPLAQVATMQLVVCAFDQNDYDRTNEYLDVLQRELAGASWSSLDKVLHARAAQLRGLVQFETGHPHDALRSYLTSLQLTREAGQRDWEAGLNALVGQNYELLGDAEKAWEHRRNALLLAFKGGRPQRQEYVLQEASIAAVMYGRRELGDILTRRWLEVANASKSNDIISTAHTWRARWLTASGAPDAVAELRRARMAAFAIGDADAHDRAMANLEMAEGELLASGEPRMAIRRLTDSLQFLDANGNHLLRAEVFAARATAYENLHDDAHAAADRELGIAELEAQRGGISDDKLRATFIAVARRLYTDAISLAVTSGDYTRGFDLAERSRATAAGVAPPLNVERLRQFLPAGVALVEYAALPRRTVAWIVRREGVTATILPSDGGAISAAAERMIAERTDPRAFAVAAGNLYSRIIEPLRPRIASAGVVVFIADPAWSRFPFAALLDPVSGRFLCEDFDVAAAPSASRLTVALAAANRARAPERVLVCADPDAGDVPRLAAARNEGDFIGRTFPGATVLSGTAATRTEFLARARFATLIHFAGHALADTYDGDYSALLFSGDGRGGSGALYAWEVRKLDLSRTRLVVLSACGTDAISDAFLAAGAPATIATLWDIGDAHGDAVMSRMYRRLHDGDTPSHALRAAQLAVLHDPGSRPADWAGFELVGL